MKIKYKIYDPAGNITALVIGDEYNSMERKIINDRIMEKEENVEQVGFLSKENIRLTMAGGEFCGNATRCAVAYYLKEQNSLELEISNQKIKAGIDEKENVWCEIPIDNYKVLKLDKEIYKIILKGITILVIKHIGNYRNLKQKAKKFIKYYNLDYDAVGVMFIDIIEKYIKIYPIVWVKKINTFFLENACGSGTIAVTMLETLLKQKSKKYSIIQPSGETLETDITIEKNIITKAILKGKIKTDNKIREIIIEEE